MPNSFNSRSCLRVGDCDYDIYHLGALERAGFPISRLPFSLKILLECLLRTEDGHFVTASDIEALARWDPAAEPRHEIAFTPSRVLLQDFTGVPALLDLAAMRDAIAQMEGDPRRINPLLPVDLVIDHSVQVDAFGTPDALSLNVEKEFGRNRERYLFLRWCQKAFRGLRVVPPGTGIVHQVNLEYLASVVFTKDAHPHPLAYPDTLIGTDSHTTMVNGLGVLGWGVGGIEAEAAMLGQPVSLLIPQVVGVHLTGCLPEEATATDLVLTLTQLLRQKGVVGKFVEFFGEGLTSLALADRATVANMAPEYGATCGFFPVDAEALRYLEFTGRRKPHVRLVEAYLKEQGLFYTPDAATPVYSDVLHLDLGSVEPSLAGPRRPQDRVPLREAKRDFQVALSALIQDRSTRIETDVECVLEGEKHTLRHGVVVIASITSCTNTSNPAGMVAAGLLAKKAVERGLRVKPWVKTSLAPGSRVVSHYLREAGLLPYLERLRFHVVGYGCLTCIGNSGLLPTPVHEAIERGDLVAVAVLSGNRNFEGRVHPDVRANYLASPPLVVAYALAGRMDIDLYQEPLGTDLQGRPVFLRDIWPSRQEVLEVVQRSVRPEMFEKEYASVFEGPKMWRSLPVLEGDRFAWDPASTYVRQPPFFMAAPRVPNPVQDIVGARALVVLGDSVTTDHISPAGAIPVESPAGQYLLAHGVSPEEFNSYGARRGNHEVMMRGTFASPRLRNRMVPGVEGGFTVHVPSGQRMTIFDAAMRYQEEGVPLLVLAGKEYGSGSSRDWAAKGPRLLGVRAVIAESYERIHRSNLLGMGVLPLQFREGENVSTLGLNGYEEYDLLGLADLLNEEHASKGEVVVCATRPDGHTCRFRVIVRLDTPQEVQYYRHEGILPYVLRQMLNRR